MKNNNWNYQKGNSQRNTSYSFVNPYNFIPLGKEMPLAREEGGKKYTGVIHYSLRTVTPLFIPNTSSEDAFCMQKNCKEHKSYDFFSYSDLSSVTGVVKEPSKPVIPGSEMRGMLRNNYEILTNSCMSAVDDEMLLSKRTQEKCKAGLLERVEKADGKVKYRLIRVKDDCLLRTKGEDCLEDDLGCWKEEYGIKGKEEWGRRCYIQKSLPEGTRVAFRFKDRGKCKGLALNVKEAGKDLDENESSDFIGYVLKGEKGPFMKDKATQLPKKENKHCAHVFREPKDLENQVVEIRWKKDSAREKEFCVSDLTRILDAVLIIYDKNTPGAYLEYREQYEKFKKGNGNRFFPVYFSVISYEKNQADSLFLSPACITREIYLRMLSDMAGDKKSCEKSGRLCPACSLFGTLREKVGNANVTSRIRVTDLYLDLERSRERCQGSFFYKPVTLQPLMQPKFNPEFYMKKPHEDAVFWTYEYYVDSNGNIYKNIEGVNGRKFYWHHAEFDLNKCKADPKELNKTIRPLKEDIYFRGKIYFQNISEKELNTLCYLINAGDNRALAQKEHGYKLGAAKPLGFGSVAMHVDQALVRQIEIKSDAQIALCEKPYKPKGNDTLVDHEVKEDFEKMTSFFILKGENISYPRIKPDGDIFQWFAGNHKGYVQKEGQNRPIGMPQSRDKMLVEQYLKPMEPKTVSNKLEEKVLYKKK